jgi:hypothetical protein
MNGCWFFQEGLGSMEFVIYVITETFYEQYAILFRFHSRLLAPLFQF